MSNSYIVDRVMHWASALLILFMLLNMRAQMHTVDYQIKGQVEHRQEAVELRGTVGLFLALLLVMRILWYRLRKLSVPRKLDPASTHARVVKAIHGLLYLNVALLVTTGLLMASNIDIPLALFGVQMSDNLNVFGPGYASFRDAHLFLIESFWWMIGLHFVGAMYAYR